MALNHESTDKEQLAIQRPGPNYKFSPEELRTLKQCSYESFYERSLPIGTCLAVATHFGVRSGFLKGHAKYGTVPKVMVAATMGYFLGKFSYQQKCAEKLMALPNSTMGALLRQRRGGLQESITLDPVPGLTGLPSTEVYSERSPMNSAADIDIYHPPSTMDGYLGNNSDSVLPNITDYDLMEPVPPQSSPTSYEELRRKNREDYVQSRTQRVGQMPSDMPNVVRAPTPPSAEARAPLQGKNKYGDVWD